MSTREKVDKVKISIILQLVFLLFLSLFRIFEFQEVGGVSSLVSARVTVLDVPISTSLNPSLFSYVENGGISFTFTQPYSLPELKYLRVGILLKRWQIGFSSAFLVRSGYGERTFSLGKGFSLLPSLSHGILLSFYHFSIKDYESDFLFSLSPSISFTQKPFLISAVLLHTNQPKTLYGERLPLTFLLGISASLSPGVDFYFDYEREKGESLRGGLRISNKALYSGIGFETNPINFTSGFGISLNKLDVSYGLRWHSRLRESHIINLGLKSSL